MTRVDRASKKDYELPYYLIDDETFSEFMDTRDEYVSEYREKYGVIPQLNNYQTIFINVHEIDRRYGGPEEGGWWVECGEAIECIAVEGNLSAAQTAWWEARNRWEDVNRYSIGSVLYDGGLYQVSVSHVPARDYPETWPRYE